MLVDGSCHVVVKHVKSVNLHEFYCQFADLGEHVEKIGAYQQKNSQSRRKNNRDASFLCMKGVAVNLEVPSSHRQGVVKKKIV